MSKSKIEWTDEVWNPVSGCTRVSAGCDNCYAAKMTKRLAKIESTKDKYGGLINDGKDHFNGVVKTHFDELQTPLRWRRPRRVFVNSMSDLFHPSVPFEFIDQVFAVMALTPRHTYQILTKRPERMAEYTKHGRFKNIVLASSEFKRPDEWIDAEYPLENVWLGTSVEDQDTADERIPHLLQCPAAVRFLSCEPLLGEVNFRWTGWAEKVPGLSYRECLEKHGLINQYEGIKGIHWVIVGGESGPNARPMHPDWVRSIRDQCIDSGTPFFFKQWGEYAPADHDTPIPDHVFKKSPKFDGAVWRFGKNKTGRQLDGLEWNQYPNSTEV